MPTAIAPCAADHPHSGEMIEVSSFGIRPGTGEDMVPAVRRMLAACRGRAVRIVFPAGRYDFRRDPAEDVTIAFHIRELSDLEIIGDGAEFVFHDLMMPVRIERSQRIRLQGFSVDWERPFITQGTILAVADGHVDIAIERTQYPYEVDAGRVWFTSPDWPRRRGVDNCYSNLFDPRTHAIVFRTRDNPLRLDFNARAEEVSPGVLRFFGVPRCRPDPGTIIILYHGRYIVKGIDIVGSSDVSLHRLTLHHVLAGGVVAARSTNIDIERVDIVANAAKGRVFSGVADGFHLIHCRGRVAVRDCTHLGQGDDFLNLHGRNSVVVQRTGERTVRAVRADCSAAGDEVWLVRAADVQRREVRRIVSIRRVPITSSLGAYETRTDNGIDPAWGLSTDKQGEWEVEFDAPLPAGFGEMDVFENKTWNASLDLTGCRILRSHRARGVLVTTPEPVRIEGNRFATAGAAILIEGDTSHWFESGACADVLIRGNVFEDCLTSGSDTGDRWEWGDAIITITPSHLPQGVDDEPYHRNIRIEGNRIHTFDAPLLRARSVRGLRFAGNEVHRTRTCPAFAFQRAAFAFDGCRAVAITGNRYDADYGGRSVQARHMRPADLDMRGDGRIFDHQPLG